MFKQQGFWNRKASCTMLNQEEKQKIIRALSEKISKCPMCGNVNFGIIDGYFFNIIHDNLESIKLGGTSIPTVAIVCKKCGFVSQHALGTLGLLPVKMKEKQNTEHGKAE